MADSPRKRKPLISKKQKRIVLFFGLALALPVVILGALSNQDTRQEASDRRVEMPNIILLTTESQAPESLEYMPVVQDAIGGQGINFSRAFAHGPVLDTGIMTSLAEAGYHTEEDITLAEATSLLPTLENPYALTVTIPNNNGVLPHEAALPVTSENRENCGNYVLVSDVSVNEVDVSDKPRGIRNLSRLSSQRLESLTQQKESDYCYFEKVDTEIGILLQGLGDEWKDTIIIYTAKQGKAYGEHRYTGSDCLYAACRRVPLVISYPRMLPTPVRTAELAASIDISATIRQLLGLPSTNTSAVSLLPLFTRPEVGVRPNVLLSVPPEVVQSSQSASAVRTKDFLYSELASGERELYDLQGDPLELVNQITNPEYITAIEDLSLELARLRSR